MPTSSRTPTPDGLLLVDQLPLVGDLLDSLLLLLLVLLIDLLDLGRIAFLVILILLDALLVKVLLLVVLEVHHDLASTAEVSVGVQPDEPTRRANQMSQPNEPTRRACNKMTTR